MKRKTFTLIELLVVIAIIAILAAMLLPALKSARDRSLEIDCRSKEKQISTLITFYGEDFESYLPPYIDVNYWIDTYCTYGFWHLMLFKLYNQTDRADNIQSIVLKNNLFECKQTEQLSFHTNLGYNAHFGRAETSGDSSKTADGNSGKWLRRKINQIPNPTRGMMVTDCSLPANPFLGFYWDGAHGGIDYRHNKRTNCLYVDGHAESLAEAAVTEEMVHAGLTW